MHEEFTEAYEKHVDELFRYCYFRVYDRERAKEIVHDTYLRAWDFVSRTNKKIENMRAFLYKIATNLLINESYQRKKKAISLDELRESGFEPSANPSSEMKSSIDSRSILPFIEKLEDKYREVIWMRYLEDMSVKDIAKILDESENNISVRIHRALAQLRSLVPETHG